MNSVTGESGPVNIDRPRPAISHEVPGRVERRGPVTPPVGLEGVRAPCGGVAFFKKLFSQLEFTDSVRILNAPIGWGFLCYEILALRQFSSEYVRRVKTRNSGFFK
jgi:hypothetical protein